MVTPAGIPSAEIFGTPTAVARNLTPQDVVDIADTIWSYVFALTVARFLGLK